MRLDKFLTECGLGTRSGVKSLISSGMISVNGQAIRQSRFSVQEDRDDVRVNGEKLVFQKFRYYVINKPQGVITAHRDSKHRTVFDILPEWVNKKNLVAVGRLDKDTQGLLLLTNDGQLAHSMLSPQKHVPKSYLVVVAKDVDDGQLQNLQNGVRIGEGQEVRAIEAQKIASDQIRMTITEGKYHQVKRMVHAVGNTVVSLTRIRFANLKLGDLQPGEVREIMREQVVSQQH